MNCPVCGTANESDAAYCYRCGSILKPQSGQTQPATGQTILLDQEQPSQAEADQITSAPPRLDAAPARPPSLPLAPAPDDPVSARVYRVPAPGSYAIGPLSQATQTSNLALVSLILGMLSWMLLPVIGAIGAVITGHMGRREVRESGGRLTGAGLALAGLILGYLHLALALLAVLAFCLLGSLIGLGSSFR